METIILLAHGSPKKYAKQTLLALVKKFKSFLKRKNVHICHAFLQFNKPTLEECLRKILSSELKVQNLRIVILPVFLSHGVHTMLDVPKIIKKLKKSYKGLNIKLALPLGADELLVKLLFKRYKELFPPRQQ